MLTVLVSTSCFAKLRKKRCKQLSDPVSHNVTQESEQASDHELQAANTEDKNDAQTVKKNECIIRVLLDETYGDTSWHLAAEQGFVLFDPQQPQKKIYCKKNSLVIGIKDNRLYLNDKKYGVGNICIKPKEGESILFENNAHAGTFLVVQDDDATLLVNSVPLEEYVFSVLRSESWPGWPLEVNKVFAITSRTYAIAMAKRAKKSKRVYHIKNTNEHQTYNGTHSCSIIKAAVEQTRGLFLAYEDNPIIAMFDSCCGGVVPANIARFNFAHAPYLKRGYPCTHCKRCRIYSWRAIYELPELEDLLEVQKLRDIKVTKKDKAGLVQKIFLKGPGYTNTISGKKMYSLCKDVKSFCFDIRKRSGNIIMQGRGYGHHLGLCQWGAREMVRDGWSYKRVLQFYYPGTQLMQLV